MAGNYEAALRWGREGVQLVDSYLQTHIALAATYGQLGRAAEGQPHVEAILRARPGFSCTKHRSRIVYLRDEDRDHSVDRLLKAGLPE